jgi:hypothetical protein
MDCKTARLFLDFARPGAAELPAAEADALEVHLAGCPDCEALARAERQADDHLGQAMRTVPVPEGLRDRVLARLQAERGDRNRRVLAWGTRAAAVAALIFLGIWAGLHWWGVGEPRVPDLVAQRDALFEKYTSPDQEKVQAWFQVHYGLNVSAPADFNYDFLEDYDLADFQGQRVPMLFFINGQTKAHVYLLTADQFDLRGLVQADGLDSGGYRVAVENDAQQPGRTTVIIYRGDSLQPLRTNVQQPAT